MAANAELSIVIRAVDLASAEINKVKQSTAGLKQLGSTFQAVGMQMTMVGAAIGAPIIGAVKAFADMEEQLRNVNAVLGGTEEDFQRLGKIVIDVGKRSSFSLSQVGEAMYAMASAGLSLEQLEAMTEPVTVLAESIHSDLGPAAQLVTDTMSQFGIAAEDAGQLVDVFAQAVRKSPENLERLTYGLKYAGPVMASMGKSIEDTVAALMVFEKAGMHGEKAGTALRSALAALQKPTKDFGDWLGQAGLKIKDVNPATHSLAEIIQTLKEHNFDAANSMKYLGRQAGTAFATLLNAGPEALIATRKELENVQGVAEGMKMEQLDSLAGKFRMLKSSIETMFASFGATKGDPIGKFLDKIRGLVDWFTNVDDKTKGLIMSIGGWTAGIFASAGVLALLLGTTMKMVATFKEFGAAMKGLMGSSSLLTKTFSGLKNAFASIPWSGFGAGMKSLGSTIASFAVTAGSMIKSFVISASASLKSLFALMATNPMVLAITGIVAALTLLIMNWDKVWPVIKKGIEVVANAFKEFWGWLKSVFIPIWEALKTVWEKVSNFFISIWDKAISFYKELWNGINGFIAAIFEGIKTIWNTVAEFFKKIWETAVNFYKKLWDGIKGFTSKLWDGIKSIWNSAANFSKSVWNKAVDVFKTAWSGVKVFFVRLWDGIKKYFESVVNGIIVVWNWIKEPFEKVFNFIGDIVSRVFSGIVSIVDTVVGWFVDAWESVKSAFTKVFSYILSFFQIIWKAIVKIGGPVVNFLMKAWEKFAGFWKTLWNGLGKIASWIFNRIADMMNVFIKGLNGVLWILDKLGIVKEGFRIPEIKKWTEVNVNINVDARKSVDTDQVIDEIDKAARQALVLEAGLNG